MAETVQRFIARSRPGWVELETLLRRRAQGRLLLREVRQVDRLHRQASADLARAEALYPGSPAHLFLNQLCGRSYATLYRRERAEPRALLRFFHRDFPAAFHEQRRTVALSAALLAFGILLGAVFVGVDPREGEWLVPAGVRAALSEHRMWTDGLLASATPGLASASIATNNLTVVILTFASGVLLGAGPVFILINNGLLLGAVFAACVRAGMGGELLTFICAHGPVELSTIVIAGGAGLSLGKALLEPGELPRRAALKRAAVTGVKLVLGAAPFLAGIGLVEGFISPGHLFTPWLKAGLGIALGAGFWGYLFSYARSNTAAGTE